MYFLKIISIIENYGGILILGHAIFFLKIIPVCRAHDIIYIACPKYTTVKNWPNLSMNKIQVEINEAKVHHKKFIESYFFSGSLN